MTKQIDTLVDDIYRLFNEPHKVDQENLSRFATNVAKLLQFAIENNTRNSTENPTLRMSKLGTPDRKLWYEFNLPKEAQEEHDSPTKIKFLYGNILEELLLFLAKEAGHTVKGEQGEVSILGVLGHRDCKIDGITTDVKSASKFAFQKFADGTLSKNDPFGYIAQISSYVYADNKEAEASGQPPQNTGAFLVINKESGEITLLKVDPIDMINPENRISHLQKNVLSLPEPPKEKCYQPEPFGKSGNEALHKNCQFCPFKEICWKESGLRKFRYSDGIKYLTKVVDEPRVEEIL